MSDSVESSGSGLVSVEHLGVRFRLSAPGSLKGKFVSLLKGERPHEKTGAVDIWAVKDVSFKVEEGDRLGIIGDNGAGKSTLLKAIVGIYPPTTGTVKCYGNIYPLLQLGLGFNPEMTGEENCFLAMSFFEKGKKEVIPLLEEIFDFSVLQEFRYQPLKTYSGGMISRLAFTLATTASPDILILDEVFAGGDIHWTQRALKRLESKLDSSRALIMVSHSMAHIRSYCNRCLWLAGGRIMDAGGMEVVDRYEGGASQKEITRIVREFVSREKNVAPWGEVRFEPPRVSKGVGLLRVFVANQENGVTPVIDMDQDFYLVVELSVKRPVPGLRVGFKLYSDRKLFIMYSNSEDSSETRIKVGTVGSHVIRARIAGNMLPPRGYYFDLGIFSHSAGVHHSIAHVFDFRIIGEELDGTGEAALRPLLEWKSEDLSA